MNKVIHFGLALVLALSAELSAAYLNAIGAADSLNMWVAGNGSTLIKTNDGGKTWQQIKTAPDNSYEDIYVRNAQSIVTAGMTKHNPNDPNATPYSIYFLVNETTDDGKNWTESIGGDGKYVYCKAISGTWNQEENREVLVAALNVGSLVYSAGTKGGFQQWTPAYEKIGHAIQDVHLLGNYGWAVGDRGLLLKSYDYGKNWYAKESQVTSDVVALHFADIDHGWAVTFGGEVISTVDAGETWSVQKIDDDLLTGVHFCDAQNGIVVGANGQVYHTVDGGQIWQKIDLNLTTWVGFFDVVMLHPGKAWAVGPDDVVMPIFLAGNSLPAVDPQTISAIWGPPDQLNVWQTFTVPLTASTFGVDDATFAGVLANVSKIRFRTEMMDGADTGKLDSVRIGNRFFSDFRLGQDDWAAEGDGTMTWINSGGADGNGFIQISDWASGDWHWAVAPPAWSGDWTGLIGQNITFAYQTDNWCCGYTGAIEISNEPINRLLLTTPRWTLPPGSSEQLTLRLSNALAENLAIQLDSSNPASFTVEASATIPAGQTSTNVTVATPSDAVDGSFSVITASAAGFPAARLTLTIDQAAAENIIAPNATYNGTLAGQVRVYYAVPVTADGNLSVTLTPTQSANIQLMLCTPEKIEIIRSDSWGNPLTLNVNGLKPDTYFISLWGYYAADSKIAFSLKTQFAVAALQNDVEPNDTFTAAKILSLNNQVTGHIGYDGRWTGNPADLVDWWQITTVQDGALTVTLSQIEDDNLQLAIYRPDGSTEMIRQDTWGDTTSLTINNVRNGTFFVRVYRYSTNFTPYTLQNTFAPAASDNDPEPNDSVATASELVLAKTVTGHLGYDGYRELLGKDTVDWWHFTLSETKDLKIKLTQNAAANLRMQLYKADGVTVVHNGSDTWGAGYEMNVANAAAAKYYLRIMTYGIHDSYSLTIGAPTTEPQILSADWGPPDQMNTWQTFTIPLTASTFGVDDATFAGVLAGVSKIRFRTEMHNGYDTGKLDAVRIGNRFYSAFRYGQEDWAAEGDGTMSWISSGGPDDNGYIQIVDWGTGDWHYAAAPPSWSGNWIDLIGQNITFSYQTNVVCCGYRGKVEITNEPVNRLLLTTQRWVIPPGESEQLTIKVTEPLAQDLNVSLSSSSTANFTIAASATIPAGQTSTFAAVQAKSGAAEGGSSVITAKAGGFPDARLTLTIGKTAEPDTGIGVRITAIDTQNFPAISCWVTAIDRSDNTPVDEITAVQVSVSEDGASQTATTVKKTGPGMGSKADIVFVVDLTLATQDLLDRFAGWAGCIDEWARDATVGIDARYGLVTFGSEVENTAEFSSDFAEIQAQLSALVVKASPDGKANALEALEKAAEFDYRPNAVRLVVLITDKPYYQAGQAGAGQTDLTTTELALKLYLKEIIPMVLAPDQPDFRGLVEEAGGLFFKLDIDRLSTTLCLIGRILGSQTVITYVSSDKQPDDGVRKLKVTITHNGQTHVAETLFVVGSARVAVTPADIIGRVGASFEVAVETTSMVDLGMAHFYLQYDAAKIKAEQIVEGDFLSQGGASTTFVADIEPTNSRIDITATRFDSQQIGASGSGVLCRVRFTVLVENCASTLTLSAAERVFKKLNDTVIPVTTAGATLHPISTGGQSDLLGDFNEDLDIDTHDFALLATYWKPANTATGDIGPATGTPPFLAVSPDNVVNFEDLFVFTRMWNWYHANLSAYPNNAPLQKSPVITSQWQLLNGSTAAATLECALLAQNVQDAAMGHLVVRYPAEAWNLIEAAPGEVLGEAPVWLVEHDEKTGTIDIALAQLAESGETTTWAGSGALLLLTLAPKNSATGELRAETIDLRNPDGQPIAVLQAEHLSLSVDSQPLQFRLEPNYPNPFNNRTRLAFSVPQQSQVTIQIFDVLGRPVKELVDQTYQAGQYSVDWQGMDAEGRAVGSGIYWIRMRSGTFEQSRRILLLK